MKDRILNVLLVLCLLVASPLVGWKLGEYGLVELPPSVVRAMDVVCPVGVLGCSGGGGGGGGSSSLAVGTTTITSGTNTRVPFNDSGVYNEDAGLTFAKATGTLSVSGKYLNALGSAALPSYSFTGGTGDGMWNRAAGLTLDFSVGGTGIVEIEKAGGFDNAVKLDGAYYLCWASSSITSTCSSGFGRYATGVVKATTNGTDISGLIGGGAAVASATALPVPTGSVFHVTGTTTITSFTATNLASGAEVSMIFDGILTVTNGGNIKLDTVKGNFVTTADSLLKVVFDGTNFYEIARKQ